LRVLHFRRIFAPLSESFIYDPIRRMREWGIDSPVLTLLRIHERELPGAADYLLRWPSSLPIDRLLARAFASRFGFSELDSYLWPAVRRLLRGRLERLRPDVIHAHFGPDGCLLRPLACELGIPLAVSFYGYDVSKLLRHDPARWLPRYQALFRDADLLIGISRHVIDRLGELGAEQRKLRLLPLGCDLGRFPYRDPAADYRGGPVRCLHVGRLTAKKAPLHLLRAFAQARQALAGRVALELVMAGDGELTEECRGAVRELGLQSSVILLGAVHHDRVRDLFAGAHLYTQHCMTAPDGDTEGLGMTFVEASAAGLPIIATRHDGIPDVVLHGVTGLLCEEGDVAAMTRHLVELAATPARWTAFGRAGRERVERHFDLNKTLADYLRAVQALVPRQPSAN
jgi:glycosyltransferase involved in cell wall biosynthesis